MACPVCGNTQGFVCGTCIECNYNSYDKRFTHLNRVDVDLLEEFLPEELFYELLYRHEERYRSIAKQVSQWEKDREHDER